MTVILSFFIENGDKLVVVADRQVTYPYELSEESKFFHKGIFYIFCAGSRDVYSSIVSSIQNNRRNIGNLANFINQRTSAEIQQIQERRSEMVTQDDECDYLLINTDNLDVRIIRGGAAPNHATDFDIIGAGEPYRREVLDIFSRLAPQGFQLRDLEWNDLLREKIIGAFHYLAFKQPKIGHPALFGLDQFIFERGNAEHTKITFNHSINQAICYHWDVIEIED